MKLLIVAVLFSLGYTQALKNTPVTACENGLLPPDVLVGNKGEAPCTESPCKISRSNSIVMNMNFTAPVYMENPWQRVYVDLIDGNYDLIDHDGCKGISNTVCPVAEGEDVVYNFELALWDLIPEVNVGLRFYLQADSKNDDSVVCFNIKIQIVK